MTNRTAAEGATRAGRRGALSAPALAGVGYAVAWIASQLTGAPNPSIAAPGTQLVASFAGHGGSMLAMFVLAEGVAAIALILVVVFVARAARQPGIRHSARLAAMTAAGFGIASAVVSLTELGLGAWLFGTVLPQRRTATFGTVFHALERLDGAKMFLLAAMAVALSAVAISARNLAQVAGTHRIPAGGGASGFRPRLGAARARPVEFGLRVRSPAGGVRHSHGRDARPPDCRAAPE